MPVRSVAFPSHDGVRLEGRLHLPQTAPRGVAVLCHPPTPADGLMPNVLMPSLTRALDTAGWASLRFNYRGIGRSQGAPASARSELDDVRGAIAWAEDAVATDVTAVVGWSSGATIALWACTGSLSVDVFVGLSPPVSVSGPGIPSLPEPQRLADWTTRTLLVCGSADPACDERDAAELAKMLGGEMELVPGADHAFNGRLAEMSALVTWFLR
ncbi:MAG TPA: alpha/beta fold hydrolase [Actinomycetota bacterium]|nr:alpha/beta fold hydrolase [Actinomycetota bacterium]